MKTEKRLTMALSVLVALMMLAVPLASSSNLFVDGGQTNSNGDAPNLSAPAESYTITLLLNGNENSLDKATYDNLGKTNTWYLNDDGNLCAVVAKDSKLGTIFADLYKNTDSNIVKTGYDLDSWKDEATGAVYGSDAANDTETKITSNMTFSAQWLLNDGYCEIPVIVDYKGEVKEYVKAYQYADDTQKKIIVPEAGLLTDGISDLDTYGIIVNAKADENAKIAPAIEKVYSFKATYGDNKEFEFTGAEDAKTATISADSKITIKYSFNNDKYSEIVVSSIAFKDGKDVTLYADKIRSYTYSQVYTALTTAFDDLSKPSEMTKSPIGDLPILALEKDESGKVIEDLTEAGYKLTGWNEGAQLLKSENNASSPLTLDAELNGYYVIFMSKGQSEYVYIPFGELSADKTTLDIAGVNHWVYITYKDYTTAFTNANIKSFNFASTQNVNAVENEANGKTPAAVLIACFTPTGSTAYAVFDGSKNDGNFGNEYVIKIIIPGKAGDATPLPSSNPVYSSEDSRTIFLGWERVTGNSNGNEGVYVSTDKYGEKDTVNGYAANPQTYTYTITFYDGDKVVGVFYYETTAPTDNLISDLVAFEYDGKIYDAKDLALGDKTDAYKSAKKAYDSIITPDKAGYYITQWNDANKNKVIEFIWKDGKLNDTKVDIKDMKDDLNLYAQFEPESYVIQYLNTYGSGFSSQDAKVDQTVTLYTGATFVYNGYKLVGWSDRPDGEGNKYDLGASFTLNGEQYKDLKDGTLTMYAVWEKSGSTSGDNTDGGDNNTDTYLLAGILAVIIILIILIAFLMRRKQ